MNAGLQGALMVCGTASDSGKSTIVAGLCRVLARQGVRVAPFKAQNMALNSTVTVSGAEIGRAQAAQAYAAGVEPEAAMNPVLLKPSSDHTSQVIVMGRPWATLSAAEYQKAKPQLWEIVLDSLAGLRRRFDVVICEGAGGAAEINLLEADIVNLRLAHAAGMRSVIVGDIDRGGVFASLYGTVALLPDEMRATVGGFLINKFRGDPAVLEPGPAQLENLTGLRTIGVVPWVDGPLVDAEDSLELHRLAAPTIDPSRLDVAVIRFPRISNFTDIEALALEPSVGIRLVDHPALLGVPDLVILPGTKSTVADLDWLRHTGLGDGIVRVAASSPATTILGVCGGYQMLGEKIEDDVESDPPRVVEGLGLLPVLTTFRKEKTTRLTGGEAFGERVNGYEIHHGVTTPATPWLALDSGDSEGASVQEGRVLGTSLHGLFEADGFRSAFLARVARRAGKEVQPSNLSFAKARSARADRIADLLEQHVDIAAIVNLIGEAHR